MNVQDLRSRYLPHVPFTTDELYDALLKRSFNEAVKFYNKHVPRIVKENLFVGSDSYTFSAPTIPTGILRIYYVGIGSYSNDVNTLTSQWEYWKPTLDIAPGNYTIYATYNHVLATIDLDEHDLLDDLVRMYVIMGAADKRRIAGLNELPIDFKGDQFHEEAKTEALEIKRQIMEELKPVHL